MFVIWLAMLEQRSCDVNHCSPAQVLLASKTHCPLSPQLHQHVQDFGLGANAELSEAVNNFDSLTNNRDKWSGVLQEAQGFFILTLETLRPSDSSVKWEHALRYPRDLARITDIIKSCISNLETRQWTFHYFVEPPSGQVFSCVLTCVLSSWTCPWLW